MVGPGSDFMNRFEMIKKTFNGEELRYSLELPGSVSGAHSTFFNPKKREITLRPEDLRGIFDPVLDRILSLILSQIKLPDAEFGKSVINVSSLS